MDYDVNACEILKTALLTMPVTLTGALFVFACATFGGAVVYLYMTFRWHRGIHHQRRQAEYDRLFKDTQ